MLNILLLVGVILAVGYVIGRGTHALKLTGVVGYIIAGIILGPIVGITGRMGIGEAAASDLWSIATDFTLALVAFIIGSHLTLKVIRKLGKPIIAATFGECLGAFLFVFLGVYFFTHDWHLALLLASIAPASAPAGSLAVIQEYRSRGPLTDAIIAVVGWDDALGVIIFVVSLSILKTTFGGDPSISGGILKSLIGISGGLGLGAAIGAILALVLKKVGEHESTLAILFAAILMGAGLAKFLDFSLILTCIMIGFVLVNLSPTKGDISRGLLESIMLPIYIVFFALAGMHLQPDLLLTIGAIAVIYIACRAAGLIGGASICIKAFRGPSVLQKYLGVGILCQAGVAVAFASLAHSVLKGYPGGDALGLKGITLIMATTVVFEIIGPIGVRFGITRAGEVKKE
ncbi:MAG: cation:proton antiporter [Dehalococcoidia bacterium]|nr:cation:proton antiporter [Dehalococcoidia bacterium]